VTLYLTVLENSFHACNIRIKDATQTRFYRVEPQSSPTFLDVEIDGTECDIAIAPIKPTANFKWDEQAPQSHFLNRLADKCGQSLLSFVDQMFLRVTCEYHLTDLKDGDYVDVIARSYSYGLWDRWDLFELLPMAYAFFEVEHSGNRAPLTQAFGTNRSDVIKMARKLALLTYVGWDIIFMYPLQVGRIKRLSKNRKVFKALKKFNRMSAEEREELKRKEEEAL
jgi:hypothetical protein